MNVKKILALLLAAVMMFAFAACGGGTDNSNQTPKDGDDTPNNNNNNNNDGEVRDINIGIWWDASLSYYSDVTSIPSTEDNPATGQMRLEHMRALEEKYNIRLHGVDMTYDGARESINTSIMAGTPDVDIYCMDLNFAIPPVVNGYCLPISEYAPAGSDIFTDMQVMTRMNMCDLPEDYLFCPTPATDPNAVYMLAFNWTLLQEYSLPNPQDLYDNGEWTWDVWLEMMKTVTDTSKTVPTYGWSSSHTRLLDNMLISNNTSIALGPKETLTSSATKEVLEFINDMYNTWGVARPWDDSIEHWENGKWSDGTLGFFIFVPWLAQRETWGTSNSEVCPYEIKSVPWPIGPNVVNDPNARTNAAGNKVPNATCVATGNRYMIPVGTKDPSFVYEVFFEHTNWWNGDISLRDEAGAWTENWFGDDERGYKYAWEACAIPQNEMWESLRLTDENNAGFYIGNMLAAAETPAQFAEHWKNIVQDGLDKVYGK